MLKLYLAIREIEYHGIKEVVISLADKDVIGREFYFRGVKININERFYKGKLVSKKEARKMLKKATIINFIGREAVKLGIEEGYLIKENLIYLGKEKIPHGQYIKIL